MIPETIVRELLISSCHSSAEAENTLIAELSSPEFVSLLVRIAVDEEDYEGDAPMQAAYYLSKASSELIRPHENELVKLLITAEGYAGFVALTLGQIKSEAAKSIIAQRHAEGWWPEHLYEQALKCYEQV